MLPRARKRFGQNFLVDREIIKRIVAALNPRDGETILEIGAGRGALTDELVKTGARIIALELDRDLTGYLRAKYQNRLTLIEGDALTLDFQQVIGRESPPATQTRVVGNLPYNVGTPITMRLLEYRQLFSGLILMLQREVVERMVAAPGDEQRGYLSVFVEGYAEAQAMFDVPPRAFQPSPKVWSTVIKLQLRKHPELHDLDENLLWQIVAGGFHQRRKTLANNLRAAPPALLSALARHGGEQKVLATIAIEPMRRAETLSLTEWTRLARLLQS